MTDSRLPAPGWLPDPRTPGVERYWDGDRWTGRTRDASTGTEFGLGYRTDRPSLTDTYPLTSPASTADGQHRPRRALPWLITATVALATIAAGYVALAPSTWPSLTELPRVTWSAGHGGASVAEPRRVVQASPAVIATPSPAATPSTSAARAPSSDYPTFGSTDLVRYLEQELIAQTSVINVSDWASGDDAFEIVTDAMREAIAQNPYIYAAGWESVREGTTDDITVTVRPQYLYDNTTAQDRRETTLTTARLWALRPEIANATTSADKAAAIHDAINAATTYNTAAADAIFAGERGTDIAASQDAFSVFTDGTAVCNGYAHAFTAVAHEASLEAITVTGTATTGTRTGAHAWNLVRIDDNWMVVDTTWDDAGDAGGVDYLLINPNDPLLDTRTADTDWIVDAHLNDYPTR